MPDVLTLAESFFKKYKQMTKCVGVVAGAGSMDHQESDPTYLED